MAIFTTDLIINGKKYKNLMVSGSSDDISNITTAHLTNAQAKKLLGDAYNKNFYQVDLQNHLWEIPQTGKNRSKYVGELNTTTSYLLANGGKIIKLKNDFVINITLTMLKKMGIYDSKNSVLNNRSINAALKRKITNQTLFYAIGTDTLKYTVDEVAEALQSKINKHEKMNFQNKVSMNEEDYLSSHGALRIANGHDDNDSVQAARRLLLKKGIAKRFNNTEDITDAYVDDEFGNVVGVKSDGTKLDAGFIEDYNLEKSDHDDNEEIGDDIKGLTKEELNRRYLSTKSRIYQDLIRKELLKRMSDELKNNEEKKSEPVIDNFKSFEVGKSYYGRFVSDHDAIIIIKVLKRTKTMLTYLYNNKEQKSKIYNTKLYEYIFPDGKYSMAPIVGSGKEYIEDAQLEKNKINHDLFKSKKQEIITKYNTSSGLKIELNLVYINREFNEAIKAFGAKWNGDSWIIPLSRKNELEKELFDHYGINNTKMALCDVEFSFKEIEAKASEDVIMFGRTILHAKGRDLKPVVGYGVSASDLGHGGSMKNYIATATIVHVYDVPLHRVSEEPDASIKMEYVYP